MKGVRTFLLSLVVVLALGITAFGQDSSTAASKTKPTTAKKSTVKHTNFTGSVTAVSGTSISVKATSGDKTAAINDKTKIKDGAGAAKTAGPG